MESEMTAAVVGAVVGAILAAGGGLIQNVLSESSRRKQRQFEERVRFVREVMRNRLNYSQLVTILNEVPILFGDDPMALSLYRGLIEPRSDKMRDEALIGLILHMAQQTGMSKNITAADISKGLAVEREIKLHP